MAPTMDETSDVQDRETVSIGKRLAGVPAVTLMHDADHCICLLTESNKTPARCAAVDPSSSAFLLKRWLSTAAASRARKIASRTDFFNRSVGF